MLDPLKILKNEHDKIDDIMTYFARPTFPVQFEQIIDELKYRLLKHIQLEEEVFALIAQRYPHISATLQKTNHQHLKLTEILRELNGLNPASSACSQELTRLREVLTEYFNEEENLLFPVIRQILSEREQAEIARLLLFARIEAMPVIRR